MRDGRYGPYVNWGKVNATLPRGKKPEEITLEEALALIVEKAGKTPAKATKAKAAPKTAKATKAKAAANDDGETAKAAKPKATKPKAKTAAKTKKS